MSAKPIDEFIAALFLEAMAPEQLRIAMKVVDQLQQERETLKRQWEHQLTQARYEVQLAQRQYDAVDPDHRLVAQTLERRWNEKLERLKKLERAFVEAEQQARFDLTPEEQERIGMLARDLPQIWNAPTTTDRERKQLLRYAISEVQLDGVRQSGRIEIRVTWRSGAVTVRWIDRLAVGSWAPKTAAPVVERIRALASSLTVSEMAEQLDREGLRSAHGKPLQTHHILYIGRSRGIPVHVSARALGDKG